MSVCTVPAVEIQLYVIKQSKRPALIVRAQTFTCTWPRAAFDIMIELVFM